jgi:hypothetical protein
MNAFNTATAASRSAGMAFVSKLNPKWLIKAALLVGLWQINRHYQQKTTIIFVLIAIDPLFAIG